MTKKWGKVDCRQFKRLQNRLEKLQQADMDKFFEACAKELAARLLSKVIKRTPVGRYKLSTGKKGGTLRRAWTSLNEAEALAGSGRGGADQAKSYVQLLTVVKNSDVYTIEITNPMHYASYVEFGHRTRDHEGWVPGRFMLTISEMELENEAPGILDKKIKQLLMEVFDGK